MRNRRIYETIGVRYSDVDRMPAILADVRAYLRAHPQIDQSRTLMVNFNQFVHGAEIAFPTRTLHVAHELQVAGAPLGLEAMPPSRTPSARS